MDRLNRSGDLFLTHTKLNGKLTLRLCVGQTNTEAKHVERAWKRIREESEKLIASRMSSIRNSPLASISAKVKVCEISSASARCASSLPPT